VTPLIAADRYVADFIENHEIYIHHLYSTPQSGESVGISQSCLVLGKLEISGYHTLKC